MRAALMAAMICVRGSCQAVKKPSCTLQELQMKSTRAMLRSARKLRIEAEPRKESTISLREAEVETKPCMPVMAEL